MCLADDMALNDSNKRVFRLAVTMFGLLEVIRANTKGIVLYSYKHLIDYVMPRLCPI